MKRTLVFIVLSVLLTAAPGWAVDKEVIQLQQSVALLQGMVREIQRSVDEKMAVLHSLVQQSGGEAGKLSAQIAELQKLIQASAGATSQHVEAINGQVMGLQSSLDDLRARLENLSGQVAKIEENSQNVSAGGGATGEGVSVAPPAPDVLYNTALRDYTSGNYPLALQEFFEYLRYYANTALASNAQFFIGDIYYQQGQFEKAIQEYDKAIEQFPDGNKTAAAKLKKGFAMLNLNLRSQGMTELKDLAAQFPNTPEAQLAKDKLTTLEAERPGRRATAR